MVTSKSAEVGDRILKVTFCFILMEEIWKDVSGYENLYQVSNLGRVRSLTRVVRCKNGVKKSNGKILKNCFDNNYYHVTLYKHGSRKMCLVHRLVATAFLKKIKGKEYINHKDGNKRNNNVNNLEWCTPSENAKHAFLIGLNITKVSHYRGIRAYMVNDDLFVGEFKSLHEAARVLNLNVGHICSVLHKRTKHTKGYYFIYNNKDKLQNRNY